jgi:hypothetical protein
MFISGARLENLPIAGALERMERICTRYTAAPPGQEGAGHWVQQDGAEEVRHLLLTEVSNR